MNSMMKNECWNVPTCHDAGKGDKPRPQNARAYRSGFDAIDWSKRSPKESGAPKRPHKIIEEKC